MFEREIKFIYDFNLNKVNRLGPYFTFEQLLTADLHPAILQYISAEIDYLIYEDRQKLLKNSAFDYSGEKISYLFNQISEEVKKSKRFSQEYIAKLVLHASSFNINYLVRPKWTLTKFVYDEENIKSSNDIRQILNYLYYYKHINKILVSYINSKKILSMNLQEFEELLERTDKLGVDSYLSSILENALKSMGEFFNIGEIQKTRIPLSAVEMFLEEKDLGNYLDKMTEVFGNDENARFTISDYQKVFKNILEEKEEALPEIKTLETEESEIETPVPSPKEEFAEEEISSTGMEEEKSGELPEDNSADESAASEEYLEEEKETSSASLFDEEEEIEEEVEEESEADKNELHANAEQDEEIVISAPLRYRIKINEDNRIEPVDEEEPAGEADLMPWAAEELTDEDLEREVKIQEDLEEDTDEENVSGEIPAGTINFEDELNSAKDRLEDISEDDDSFLRSLRDQEEIKLDDVVKTGEEIIDYEAMKKDLQEQDEEKEIEEKKSVWPEYIIKEDDLNIYNTNKDGEESKTGVDLAGMLEHRDMTKIIEVIFDYDIEDFANTLDEITNCKNQEDALIVVNQTLKNRHIAQNSKEADLFNTLISQYFKR